MRSINKIWLACCGILIMDFGVGVLIKANCGVDALNVFLTGAADQLQLSVGTVTLLVNMIMLGMVLLIDRKQIGVASLLETLLCKFPLDLAYRAVFTPEHFPGRITLCLLAIGMISFGVALMMISEQGLCVYDALSSSISRRSQFNYVVVRYICDGVYLLAGHLLKGQIGIGTILCFLLLGVVINYFKNLLKRLIQN